MTPEEQQQLQQVAASMTPEAWQEFQAAATTMARLLYENTPDEKLQDLESIELALREHWLKTIGPKLGAFF